MKFENKEILIILISAIVLISAFEYAVRAVPILTGVMIFRDIPLTQENYQYLGNEVFSADFYLPSTVCTGFVNYCSYVYSSDVNSKADINKDGKIDEIDATILQKSYGCAASDSSCWNKPVEECFFIKNGRRFRDPTRDCKMDQDDAQLVSANMGNDPYVNTGQCENNAVCRADINQDGSVDSLDAIIVSNFYGKSADSFERIAPHESVGDLNGDGTIDILDAIILSKSYGKAAIERKCNRSSITHTADREYGIYIEGVGITWVQASYQCPTG
jgi:hypothetical protein